MASLVSLRGLLGWLCARSKAPACLRSRVAAPVLLGVALPWCAAGLSGNQQWILRAECLQRSDPNSYLIGQIAPLRNGN